MKKTLDYIFGVITGASIMIAVFSCTTPLNAEGGYNEPCSFENNQFTPVYVKIVE